MPIFKTLKGYFKGSADKVNKQLKYKSAVTKQAGKKKVKKKPYDGQAEYDKAKKAVDIRNKERAESAKDHKLDMIKLKAYMKRGGK